MEGSSPLYSPSKESDIDEESESDTSEDTLEQTEKEVFGQKKLCIKIRPINKPTLPILQLTPASVRNGGPPKEAQDLNIDAVPAKPSKRRRTVGDNTLSDGETAQAKKARTRKEQKSTMVESTTIECFVVIDNPPKIELINKKAKAIKQLPWTDGPFHIDQNTSWDDLLLKIATLCKTNVTNLMVSSLTWKWQKPANSTPLPLSSNAGFDSLKSKLKGTTVPVMIHMPPPVLEIPAQPVWTNNNIDDNRTVEPESATIKGRLDTELDTIIEQLEAKYPYDTCQDHPRKQCFWYRATNKHFDLCRPKLIVWAREINAGRADTTMIPVNTNGFKDKDALPNKPSQSSRTEENHLPPNALEQNSGIAAPTHVPIAMPQMQHMPMYAPYLSQAAHMGLPLYPSQYGMPLHMMNPYGFPMAQSMGQSQTSGPLSSPPSSQASKSISMEEYCEICKHNEEIKIKLDNLGFQPGDRLTDITEAQYKEARFKPLEWQCVCRANEKFLKDLKNKK